MIQGAALWRAGLLALSLLGAGAQANERLPMTDVRFSASGERVLIVVSGEQDGSGFGQAAFSVLSTRSGAVLASRTVVDENAIALEVRRNLLAATTTQTLLRSMGLHSARASVPRYQRAYPAPYPRWEDGVRPGAVQVTPVPLWSRPVPVSLKVVPLPASACDQPELLLPGERPAGFELRVGGQLVRRQLSAGSRCVSRYTLERVDVQGNRVLLALRAYAMGFEGPDALPVFVAVTVK
ncbi:DUF2259 domain-containing protein [Deinococcus arcticus]|uniref:DUF2259 domain-containing protein n=1 Tax=Deinococcus arcticus TaxID=2136176 RepID=A0A2T3WCZ4_9DEIO|nr:DUF2259 domain-containing protein [Deinococcus arcticus]PTA69674.1 hypothetical protein C8263_01240 [Deinococcus arcticus]